MDRCSSRRPVVDCKEGNSRDELCRSAMYLSAYIFSFARKGLPDQVARSSQRKGAQSMSTQAHSILCTGQPSFIPNKRPYTSFSDRTGDNVDKSTVLRKNFHPPGVFLEKRDRPEPPARRRGPTLWIARDDPEDWHKYCIERVIGGIETGFSGFSGWDSPASPVTTPSGK